jgi:DNA-binding GntR family transcriptional regulator
MIALVMFWFRCAMIQSEPPNQDRAALARRSTPLDEAIQASHDEHRQIFDALLKRDALRAAEIMHRHIQPASDIFEAEWSCGLSKTSHLIATSEVVRRGS